MIRTLKVRGVVFGEGIPKICVPVAQITRDEILQQVKDCVLQSPDCIEFRADWFEQVFDCDAINSLLTEIRNLIGDTILLFTFRSAKEGGEKEIEQSKYFELCKLACESGCIDLIDVEAYMEPGVVSQIAAVAHENGVYVVGSNHDFERTPSAEELTCRLHEIDEMGADIPKVAVMPNDARDVLNLLSATLAYYENGGLKPLITMSMKDLGCVSRVAGELVGSVLTFATIGKASAPGQIPIDRVRDIMETLHN